MAIPDEAVKLECGNQPCHIELNTGERIQARVVVIATGARYRRLAVERLDAFEGSSVHYWASPLEADLCAQQDVALVGGGNSAGQATVFLATRARRVTLIARRPLSETMSQYLIERIEAQPNIDVVIGCEISALEGADGVLEGVSWRDRSSGKITRRGVRYLFSFIGAEPNTDWLAASGLKLDDRGFVLTGEEIEHGRLPLETSRAGVFAVGDVRSCSVKRVAASVGDGAQVVASIHAYLARHREAPTTMTERVPVTA
jgi:thioredoxin reductase (NADPH)